MKFVFFPSITSISLSTLSIVTFITVLASVDVNATVSAALNVPVMPLTLTRVFPSPFIPSLLSNACTPRLAKYVNEFNHSILAPFVAVRPSTPGQINVQLWNNIAASLEFAVAYAPSTYAPLPASPALNPLGSSAVVVLPFVMVVMFLMYGERLVTSKSVAKRKAYPLSGNVLLPPLQLNTISLINVLVPTPASGPACVITNCPVP